MNHYKYMKQKVKSDDTKQEKEDSHNCLAEWDKNERTIKKS